MNKTESIFSMVLVGADDYKRKFADAVRERKTL